MFEKLCSYVRTKYGDNAVPLCLAVYSDGTKVNPSGSRTEDPISVYILNACDQEKIPILVGYHPVSSYSNKIKLNLSGAVFHY